MGVCDQQDCPEWYLELGSGDDAGFGEEDLWIVLEKVWQRVKQDASKNSKSKMLFILSSHFQDFQMRYENNPLWFPELFFFLLSCPFLSSKLQVGTNPPRWYWMRKVSSVEKRLIYHAMSRTCAILFLSPVRKLTFLYAPYSAHLPLPNTLIFGSSISVCHIPYPIRVITVPVALFFPNQFSAWLATSH